MALDVFAHAAGDVDRCAGDVARAVTEQKRNETRDLVGQPETTEWHLLRGEAVEELLARQLRGSAAVDVLPLGRDHKADVDTVDENVVLRNLECERFRERVAGRAVDRGREEGGIGVTRVDGTDVDDPAAAGGA